MSYLHVSAAQKAVGKEVKLRGWVHRKRESGGIAFIVLRDLTGIMQVAVKKGSVGEASWKAATEASVESSIEISGTVKADERAPTGFEVEATAFKLTNASEPFPITEYQSTELLLDKRHLWLRSTKMVGIMRLRSIIFRYTRAFMDKHGFYEVTPPLITKAGGETGSSMFEIDYYGQKAYLTESSQLYAEAMIYSLEKVYSFVPSFRAEKSRTNKHLSEYWHLEPEMAYYTNEQSMKLQERLVSYVANKLGAEHADELKALGADAEALLKIKPPFKRLTYEKMLDVLADKGKKLSWGDDIGVDEERLLMADEDKPVFITYWPRELKPFYMPVNPKDERTVLCADLQAPHGHGEIIGGSQRIWKYDEAMERFHEVEKAKGVKFNLDNYSWYLDLLRYGSVPHSGFGMGIERTIKWLLNLEHIRDAIPFPRMVNRLAP
jgi:asparaginyl-tRNA synthetase